MFKLNIQGYGDKDVIDTAGFIIEHNSQVYITLFAGYSEYEIKKGEKIRTIYSETGRLIIVNLEIIKVSLGFSKPVDLIPSGFKTIILVKGTAFDIFKVKKTLPKVKNWNETQREFLAFDKDFLRGKRISHNKSHINVSGHSYTVNVCLATRVAQNEGHKVIVNKTSRNRRRASCWFNVSSKERMVFKEDLKRYPAWVSQGHHE